jgi:hypothetical protein
LKRLGGRDFVRRSISNNVDNYKAVERS